MEEERFPFGIELVVIRIGVEWNKRKEETNSTTLTTPLLLAQSSMLALVRRTIFCHSLSFFFYYINRRFFIWCLLFLLFHTIILFLFIFLLLWFTFRRIFVWPSREIIHSFLLWASIDVVAAAACGCCFHIVTDYRKYFELHLKQVLLRTEYCCCWLNYKE